MTEIILRIGTNEKGDAALTVHMNPSKDSPPRAEVVLSVMMMEFLKKSIPALLGDGLKVEAPRGSAVSERITRDFRMPSVPPPDEGEKSG